VTGKVRFTINGKETKWFRAKDSGYATVEWNCIDSVNLARTVRAEHFCDTGQVKIFPYRATFSVLAERFEHRKAGRYVAFECFSLCASSLKRKKWSDKFRTRSTSSIQLTCVL
jgi:hypothetical protein